MSVAPPPFVLVRADAGPRIGGGHVMRCLALADALRARGAAVGFAVGPQTLVAAPALGRSGHAVWELARPFDPRALTDLFAPVRIDALLVDHYGLDATYEGAARARARTIIALDDLADRPRDADLLIDPTLDRTPEDYAGLTPRACSVLTGPAFAPLRPAFAAARPKALARRNRPGLAVRCLVSMGLTDVEGITAALVAALLDADAAPIFDVVIGPGAQSRPMLEAFARHDPRLKLWIDPPDMAALMTAADLAIGAAGSTAWERCALGLPTVMLPLAPNQRATAEALALRGAAITTRTPAEAANAARWLAEDAVARAEMARAAARVTDGAGAGRVAEAILARISTADDRRDHAAVA